jgi:hypothetical protein
MPEVHTIALSSVAPQVSIVFIHGSDGNYISTWGPSDHDANWIYWIGADHNNVDVFSVQHEGSIWSLTDYATITEYAETISYALSKLVRTEKIFFIGHSLGGIIIKQIAIMIESDTTLSSLADKGLDFCFIATPHLGGNFGFARSAVRLIPNKLMGLVFGWNSEVQEINDKFLQLRNPTLGTILCFAERKRFFGFKLIENSSAFIQDKQAINLAISRHHTSICTLTSRQDVIYLSVSKLCKHAAKRTLVGEAQFELDQSLIERAFRG